MLGERQLRQDRKAPRQIGQLHQYDAKSVLSSVQVLIIDLDGRLLMIGQGQPHFGWNLTPRATIAPIWRRRPFPTAGLVEQFRSVAEPADRGVLLLDFRSFMLDSRSQAERDHARRFPATQMRGLKT